MNIVCSSSPSKPRKGVLLNLLWHLACDINNNPSQKLSWTTVVAKAIIPTDSTIAVHVQPILFQVYNILTHLNFPENFQMSNATHHLLVLLLSSQN
jgi:enhancer of mRNA-decapping protein 4